MKAPKVGDKVRTMSGTKVGRAIKVTEKLDRPRPAWIVRVRYDDGHEGVAVVYMDGEDSWSF